MIQKLHIILLTLVLVLTSCKEDTIDANESKVKKDKTETLKEIKEIKELELSENEISMILTDKSSVTIKQGNGGYEIASNNSNIKAELKTSTIEVEVIDVNKEELQVGIITIKDSEGKTAKIIVNVKYNKNSLLFRKDKKIYEVICDVKYKKTWDEAKEISEKRGGYLAEINNQEEQNLIFDNVKNLAVKGETTSSNGGGAAYLWLGASDISIEGNWKWNKGGEFYNKPTNEVFAYHHFATPTEPDNYFGQNALAIALTRWPYGSPGQWNDLSETVKIYFIIEYDQ